MRQRRGEPREEVCVVHLQRLPGGSSHALEAKRCDDERCAAGDMFLQHGANLCERFGQQEHVRVHEEHKCVRRPCGLEHLDRLQMAAPAATVVSDQGHGLPFMRVFVEHSA
eukprot:1844927-Prymnesium_polylepis.1